MRFARSIGAAGLSLALVAPSTAAQSFDDLSDGVKGFVEVGASSVAITDVKLIDGTGAEIREGQTVIVENGRITAVGPTSSTPVPEGAETIDGTGHTLIPGLVGLHNHMFFMAVGGRQTQGSFTSPRLYLGAGVTTIRTTGSVSPYADINVKHNIDSGDDPGPRIHVTAPYLTGADAATPDMATVTTPEQARRFVAYWAEEGATWIKAYTSIRRAELAAAIDEAHRHGMKVTGHLCSITFQEAVELGIDNIEHSFGTASDFIADKEPDECPGNQMIRIGDEGDPGGDVARAVILKMVESGVGMTSTMAVIEPFIPGRETMDPRMLEAMAPEVREAYTQAREQIDAQGDDFPFKEDHLKKSMAFDRGFVEAGGVLAAGVDPTGIGGAIAGFGDQRNYELLSEAGFSPGAVIKIMAANGAIILGEDELGTVEVGKLADLVLLEGDLGADPTVIKNVTIVFKDGVGYDSKALIASVKGRVGIN